jgi:2-C-methyl-D-erythritol 4-phosphate cytidylyltransferase
MKKLNVAVILAAGRGERSGFEQPKQLMKLAGRPIIEHTIAVFQGSDEIDEILVVTSKDCISKVEDLVATRRFDKVKGVILGGSERYESSVSAIEAYETLSRTCKVRLIFHDAVRPLVNERIIKDVVDALDSYNAVDVAVPTTDTIISVNPISNTIDFIPERGKLRNGQTPQGFAYETIKAAYHDALRDPSFKTTDDCGVVLKYLPDEKIYVVAGENDNIKLTYREDLHMLDKLLQLKSKRNAANIDTKSFSSLKNKVMVIFGGTSGIGAEMAKIAEAHQAFVIVASRRTGTEVSDIESINRTLNEVHDKHQKIDYVVNAAGILSKQPLVNMGYQEVLEAIQINYMGAVNVAIASFEHLRQSRGQLLNFTSSSYTYGRAYYSLYSSSKAAVVNLTQALAEEWHSEDIRVNCINPERTDTPMRRRAFGREPAETLLTAEAVASQALSVLIGNSTGQVFDIRRL